MFLSVIIPVYNTEKYLDECLLSLLNQDIPKTDYEIICVNDGSTDGSLNVLRNYAIQNKNIVVIEQENGGVCRARNAGMDLAQGDYIWFVDADDYIQVDVLGELRGITEDTRCDRLMLRNYHFEDDDHLPERGPRDVKNMRLDTSWYDSVVWRSLFRRVFLKENHLRFHYEELVYGEDALFLYEVKRCMPRGFELKKPIYYHRERAGSASTATASEMDLKRLQSTIREAEIVKNYYEQHDGIMVEETANRFMSFIWGALYRIAQMPGEEAAPYIRQLRERGLYPYKRPKECSITKSYQTDRKDWVGQLHDKIYINISTQLGYCAMRSWFWVSRVKNAPELKSKEKGVSPHGAGI